MSDRTQIKSGSRNKSQHTLFHVRVNNHSQRLNAIHIQQKRFLIPFSVHIFHGYLSECHSGRGSTPSKASRPAQHGIWNFYRYNYLHFCFIHSFQCWVPLTFKKNIGTLHSSLSCYILRHIYWVRVCWFFTLLSKHKHWPKLGLLWENVVKRFLLL